VGRKRIGFRQTAIDRIVPLDDDLVRWIKGEIAVPISGQQIDEAELQLFKECKKGQRSLARRPLTPFLHYLKDLPRDADFDVNKQAVIFFNLSQEEKAVYVERSQQEKMEMEYVTLPSLYKVIFLIHICRLKGLNPKNDDK
jgi:hypothetical protein